MPTGTVYRSNCLCLTSLPEPLICEYDTIEQYREVHRPWLDLWQERCQEHETETGHRA